jgi:hypothetical protein
LFRLIWPSRVREWREPNKLFCSSWKEDVDTVSISQEGEAPKGRAEETVAHAMESPRELFALDALFATSA